MPEPPEQDRAARGSRRRGHTLSDAVRESYPIDRGAVMLLTVPKH